MLTEDPMCDGFLRALGRGGRLVVFDKPGVGVSDPFDRGRDYFEQVAEAFVGKTRRIFHQPDASGRR